MVALLFALVALVATGGWIVYYGVLPSLQAEKTLHATMFAVRLLERFVSERGRWPRSWGELEGVSMDDDRWYGEGWPATAPELQRRVSIDFEIDPLDLARQDPMSITAIRPIGPHFEWRDYGSVKSLQEAILKSMTPTPGPSSNIRVETAPGSH